ncbi:hypothetical protein [Vagococcus fluvialis]|uniref:hypothetical protein n=1 Tax=Vagococcus fluvialis TaxID=2738 RepID=UPI0022E739C4|nr:hypothetical protein [Vagococcus fluvialis]
MKELIINALKDGKKVSFKFEKENTYSANVLIDELSNDDNYIFVGQFRSGKQANNDRIINLSVVQNIGIEH